MPALFRGKASSPDGRARIITTSSASAYLSTLQWGTFKDGQARRKLSKYALYNQSKFVRVPTSFVTVESSLTVTVSLGQRCHQL